MSKTFLFLVAIIPLIAFTQTNLSKRKANELLIHGTLSNIKEPVSYVYIICLDCNTGDIDSARVIDGKYNFRFKTGVTTLFTLFIKNPAETFEDKYMLTLIAEPSPVTISSTDSFSNAKVSGSGQILNINIRKHKPSLIGDSCQRFLKADQRVKMLLIKRGWSNLKRKLILPWRKCILTCIMNT